MPRTRMVWRMGWVGCGLAVALALTRPIFGLPSWLPWPGSRSAHTYATAPVRRTDLDVKVTTSGRVESAEKTLIECKLEAMAGMPWGNSTILSLMPEGTMVKKGDVLCSLDSSRYDEALRLQQIYVGQVRADVTKAELDLQVAKLAVVEYREGLMQESLKLLKGQIALMQSDRERTVDRLGWARRMFQKGYLSRAQVATEESNVAHIEHNLKMSETALQMFEVWTAPKALKILEAAVLMARSIHNYQTSRLAQAADELQFLEEQVAACTIKAPHDGFLIYYTYPRAPDYRIQEGTIVWRTQKLFYLPDLDRMEVATPLHETVVKEVRPGMEARIEVEGLHGRVIEGHVDSIATLPSQQWFSEVKYFDSTIKLHSVPAGLRPGMTSSVKLLVQKRDVLAIPLEAIAVEQGRYVCYVVGERGLCRREVKTGQSNSELIEVTEGLEEGESVVLNPPSPSGAGTAE